jgi:hypothetical protein
MTDLDLAEAIQAEFESDATARLAAEIWADLGEHGPDRWTLTLTALASIVINRAATRRQSELARIGPWGNA